MARATRSSTIQDKDKTADPAPPQRKNAKKRKRTSIVDGADEPAFKQPRTDDDIKEEDIQEQDDPVIGETIEINLPSSGDIPIQTSDAQKILEILEIIDTQGLLDRVFPLPPESGSTPASSSNSTSHSFRDLLQNASHYPLRTLRSAVQHLFPITSHPRSRPSAPAVEQQRFCNLAISLLDQASSHNSPVPLNVDSIVSAYVSATAGPSGTAPESKASATVVLGSPAEVERKPKYAMVQRLPTGEWWSSVNSDTVVDGNNLTDLPTGRAELAVVLPSPSSGAGVGKTLGEYVTKKPSMLVQSASYMSQPRRISCGKFLDYGPYASFAPSFDQDGKEVGRVRLGEVIWFEERKRRIRELARGKQKAVMARLSQQDSSAAETTGSESTIVASQEPSPSKVKEGGETNIEVLEGLLSPEQIANLKSTLGSLELEQALDELLTRNAKAMQRLEELQLERLGGANGGSSTVEVGSEEWETAQSILDSLTVLASLRPRSSKDAEHPPLIPTTSALRRLHRTLPSESHGGWYGTLPAGRTAALRDDNTLYVRAGITVPAAATAPPVSTIPTTPATPAIKTATPTPTTQYSGYPYPGYTSTGQYRGGYGTFTPGQTTTTNYYSSYQASQQAAAASNYYPNSQYNAAAGQQQYSYGSSWHNYHPQTAASSGRATPQPAVATNPSTNYTTYYASAAQQPQPQRAVTNTVLGSTATPKYQPAAWSNGANAATNYATSALPTHLRPVATGSTPTTPQMASPYYSGYSAATPR
ncbi:unnamed protein product [Somion occarium]|uniref:Uncharacterized protein n=1 Tax=Somion occarium TaxID=3059160 RepID=A0ABP1CLM3_9APHY